MIFRSINISNEEREVQNLLNSMYISTTAMKLNQKISDINANNLANANTTGYKKDIPILESFPDVLLSKINDKADFDNHQPFAGVVDDAGDGAHSLSVNSGYFRVLTPGGISHNRDLKFTQDADGYLKTFYRDVDGNKKINDENFVLGRNGKPIQANGQITVDNAGNVLSNGQQVENLLFFPSLDVIGTTNAGVKLDKVVTDFTEGNIMSTGNKLDFALRGPGFFKVQGADGKIFYTRDGSFTLNNDGTLITKEGMTVLGENGPIRLNGTDITADPNGELSVDGVVVAKLGVVDIANKEDLRKIGNNLYTAVENGEIIENAFEGQILNESLEGSNIDVIKEMVGMITGFRSYETSQKIISTQDELLGKVVNDLGRV